MYVKHECPSCGDVKILDIWACSEVSDHSRYLDHMEVRDILTEEEFLSSI